MLTAVELGLVYAIMALGVYLTFRILDFPDLTVDGSFTTDAAVASISIVNGMPALCHGVAAVDASGEIALEATSDSAACRSNLQTAAHNANSRWLFPSTAPGQHLTAALISERLKAQGIPAQLGRTAAWRHMVRDAPPSVLAELLGFSPATAMRHADLAGANFTRYAALRQEVPRTGHP